MSICLFVHLLILETPQAASNQSFTTFNTFITTFIIILHLYLLQLLSFSACLTVLMKQFVEWTMFCKKNLFHMFFNLGRFDYKRTKFWRMAMGRRTNCIQHRRSWPRYLLRISQVFLNTIFPALIINLVGLGISTIVFVIEIIFCKTNKR